MYFCTNLVGTLLRPAARVISSRPLALPKAEMALSTALKAPCSAEGRLGESSGGGQQDGRADGRFRATPREHVAAGRVPDKFAESVS